MKIHLSQPLSFNQLGQRANQEDARFPDVDRTTQDRSPFFVVCDGVGGQDRGEVASRTVCDAFGKAMAAYDLSQPFGLQHFAEVFADVYGVFSQTAKSTCESMATTLTFICFHADGFTAAHCGDSRIYQVRPGQGIVYKSEDHSLVQQMVRGGIIRPEEAESHPQSNIITRCIMLPQDDGDQPMASVLTTRNIAPGDYFFLCSDGVVHQVTDAQLTEILSDQDHTDDEKMALLSQLSKDSIDNNTAYLLHVDSIDYMPGEQQAAPATAPVIYDVEPGKVIGANGEPSSQASTTNPIKKNAATSLVGRIKGFLGI